MIPGVIAGQFVPVAAPPSSYWIATLGGTGLESQFIGRLLARDADDNLYVVGQTDSQGAGSTDALLAKFDSAGNLQWQRVLGGSGIDAARGVVVSGSSIYVVGYTSSQGAGSNDALIAKYNSSGTLQWQRVLGITSADFGFGLAGTSGGGVCIVGLSTPSTQELLVATYDSSGTLQWQRTLYGTASGSAYSVAVGISGSIYVAGYTIAQGAGSNDALIAKYNSSGTLQWQRVLGGSAADLAYAIAVDAAESYVYIAGMTASRGAGACDVLLAKYDASGAIQGQRVLGGASDDYSYDITISGGDIYLTGYTSSQGAGSNDVLIAKYNSTLTLQWQRVLGGTGADIGRSIVIDSTGAMVVAGSTTSAGVGGDLVLARLPSDGSLTGVYGSFTYSASTLTSAASTLTAATSTLTSAAGTLTSATSTLASAISTLASTKTSI